MDEIQVAAYSLVVRVLLVTSGLEENPGPETQNAREVEQLEDWEWSEVEYETAILQTKRTKCTVCGVGELKPIPLKEQQQNVIIYTRNGTRRVKHCVMRCNNKNPVCRAYHGFGHYQTKGHKIFEDDALRNKVLMTSTQTGFEIDYLVEICASVEINSDAFEGLAKVFNRLHNNKLPTSTSDRRIEVHRKRLTDAYFLYIYLEFCQRSGIANYQVIENSDLDETILKHMPQLHKIFRDKWAVNHKCDVKGCGWCITIDGGLKPHRMVCAAKLSGVREFPKVGLEVITGCIKHPAFNSKYCQEHGSEESPAVTANSISSRTRQQLRKYRTDTASYSEAEQDEVYVVESILEIKGPEILVKWAGFPNPTWENENGIPKFIRNYYEKNPAKLGNVLPNPKIKHSKSIGDTVIHKLSWGDEPGVEWVSDDFFKLLDDNGENIESTLQSCNTRKSRDKRQNTWNQTMSGAQFVSEHSREAKS